MEWIPLQCQLCSPAVGSQDTLIMLSQVSLNASRNFYINLFLIQAAKNTWRFKNSFS